MRRDSGFTAFEVAITLAIIAVLATAVMPSFLKWLQAHRLRGATINLVADLEMAKVRAIREGPFVAIQLGVNNYSVFLDNGAGGGTAGDMTRNGAESLIQYRQLPAGVQVVMGDIILPGANRMRFDSRGLAPDLVGIEASIPLANMTGRKDIRINRLGNLRTQ